MADKDLGDGDGPSLEMPSLGSLFKRKKKQEPAQEDDLTPTKEELDAVVRGSGHPETESTAGTESTDELASPDAEGPAAADPAGEDEPTQVVPTAEETPADEVEKPTVVVPVTDSDVEPEPTTVIPPVRDEPVAKDEVRDEPGEKDERPLFADEVSGDEPSTDDAPAAGAEEATTPAEAAATPATSPAEEEAATAEEPADDEHDELDDDATPVRSGFSLPALPARIAAAVTGLAVGALAVGLTWLALQGCEQVRGTSTCGTPGFFLLTAIMILLVVIGSALLGAWRVADPGSTSFLAVGLLAVIALLFLIRVIFSPWMMVVIPAVAIATYVLSQWLTSLFIEEGEAA